jgi:phosphatidylserine/phosphatidylglycerophosphate/cardiolipin synthase-like enzyme
MICRIQKIWSDVDIPFLNPAHQPLQSLIFRLSQSQPRGITEKIKENVVHMNRSLMNRLSSISEPQAPTTSQAVEIETPTHVEVDGQAKYWIGKDYTNFILKDFTELNQPFDDLIDRTKTPRIPWHEIVSVVVGQASRDVARHFIERWNACKLEKARDNLSYPYLMPKSYNDICIDHNFWPKTKVHLDRVTCLRSSASWVHREQLL